MKLIIEKDSVGDLFIYRESEKQFKQNEKARVKYLTKTSTRALDEQCNSNYIPLSSYMVVNIK